MTKLELLKDVATAIGGSRTILEDLANKCEKELGKDYGLRSVLAALQLSQSDTVIDIERFG